MPGQALPEPLGVVQPVLQADDDALRLEHVGELRRGALGVPGLDGDEDQVGIGRAVRGVRQVQPLGIDIPVGALPVGEPQAMLGDLGEHPGPPDEGDRHTGRGEAPTDVAADAPGAEDADLHAVAQPSSRSLGSTSSAKLRRNRSWSAPGPWKTRWVNPQST